MKDTMASKHETTQTCPICKETLLQHVHCSAVACAFVVTTCSRCDREQAVRTFVADHEKDCVHRPAASLIPDSYPAFRLPRRNAA